MKIYSWKNRMGAIVGTILLLVLWQLIAVKINNNIYLPRLSEIWVELLNIIKNGDFIKIVLMSLYRTLISFGVAVIFAIVLGIISSISPFINSMLKPVNAIGKTIPTLVLVVLALIWFNKESAPFIVGIAIVFPILYDGIVNSINDGDKKITEMLDIYEVSKIERIKKIYIPTVIFYILRILVPTFSLAFKVVIAGEVHGQPKYGIGAAVQLEKMNFNTPGIFAWIIIIAIISVIFELLNKLLTGRYYRWRNDA